MKKNWKETLKLWLGALLMPFAVVAEAVSTGYKKLRTLPKKVMAVCLAAAIVVAMVPVAVFAAETTYDIWVGGVQFTGTNLVIDGEDVTGITGSATFNPDTKTLTLDNFSYTGEGYHYAGNVYALVYSQDIDLKIVLKGTNTLAGADMYQEGIIIENGSLTFADSDEENVTGSLKLTAGYPVISLDNGSLSVENVNLTVINTLSPTGNPGDAIFVNGNILISNSDVTAISGDSDGDDIPEEGATFGIITTGSISVAHSTVSAIGYAAGIWAGSLSVANSTVTAAGNLLAMAYINTDEGLVPNLTGDYVVYAGDDAASATKADAPTDDTYASKYVKIEPVCTVTVNYGIDGVNNKENAVTKGDTISLENPVIDGYIFMGWYANADYTTAFDFDTPITAATTIYAKFADYEGDKEALQDAIDALETAVGNVETALNNKVSTDKLTEEVGKLNQAIADAKAYADTQDAALKTTLEAADATMNAAITELQNRVTALETGLTTANGKIDTNTTDINTLKTNVSTLETWKTEAQNAITALQGLTNTQGTSISALQAAVADLQTAVSTANSNIAAAEARIAVLEGKVTDLETATANLQNAVTALQAAVAGKADTATVNAAIAELQTAINALETAKNNYVGADDALRTELEGKISAAQTAAISAAETLVNNAKAELQTKIDAKADAATTTVAIQNLQAAVAALEAVKDDYATADAALKTELEGKISAAQTAAISAAETLVNNAKAELQTKIDAKADAATTTVAIQNLQAAVAALEAVKDDYATADAALKTELEGKISAAQTAAISAAETLVNNAKAELTAAINNKADTATLNAKINELNTAIATAEATAKAYTDDAAAALTTAIATAKSEAISAAETLVNNAKSELQSAIDTKADAATVNVAIANLQNAIAALENAKDNYVSADAALKTELEAAIAKAKQEAIDAAKGHIPYIGTNGNWWIGDTDTGVDANGIKGDKGDKGDTGADGVGIAKIEKTATDGNVDTYTVTLTNGKTYTFTVTNGKDGANGKDGENGKDGADGKDGLTPFIGENGNWWIGETDTGVKAAADDSIPVGSGNVTEAEGVDTVTVVAIVIAGIALLGNVLLAVLVLKKKKSLV